MTAGIRMNDVVVDGEVGIKSRNLKFVRVRG